MRKLLMTMAALCCASFLLKAQQEDSTVLRFTLEEAMNYALEHNWDLQNSSLSVRQAEADRWAAIAGMLPQVSGTLDYSNYMGYEMDLGGMMSIAMPPYGSVGVNAAMTVSGAQIVSSLIGKVSMRMADVSYRQSQQEVAEQVRLLYFSALVSEQTVELLRRNLGTVRKLHELSQKSVAAGVAEQVDADQILVQVATLETSINEAERGLEMIYNSMRLQMNVGFDKEIVLTETMDDLMDVEKSLSLLYDDFVMENNFSYQLALQSTELYRQQKNLAGWAYGPTLSAFYQYTGRKYFSDEMTMNMTPPNMIGLTLSVPIFSSGKNFSTFKKAKLEYQKQLNTLENTKMALNIQHRQLKYNLSSAYERYGTQKKNVEVSQAVLDNIGKKYEFGHASSLDVTNATTTLISAQSTYVQAALDYVTAQIELEKLLNKNTYGQSTQEQK
ncbi:MAG TPA: TolC family protein [Candidatus Coprenecus stercoravium]|uniref:TolC family protein n=1 Tax=Candidatus Coprenecus stercoravium TaxID=2840735 RepID=A0A9D2GR06_9BACT|nr:TolC family protein [Candidatus Coprenecus stercoravium]